VRIVRARHGEAALVEVLGTGRFDMERAQRAAGWLRSGPASPALDTCLLNEEEMALGPDRWTDLQDPLPPWSG
jgi:hypothetical protein